MRGLSRVATLMWGRILKTPAGRTRVLMPRPGRFASFYVFALHKSGSTLMNNMLIRAFDYAKVPHVALSEFAFSAGLPENEIAKSGGIHIPSGLLLSRISRISGLSPSIRYLQKQEDITDLRPEGHACLGLFLDGV